MWMLLVQDGAGGGRWSSGEGYDYCKRDDSGLRPCMYVYKSWKHYESLGSHLYSSCNFKLLDYETVLACSCLIGNKSCRRSVSHHPHHVLAPTYPPHRRAEEHTRPCMVKELGRCSQA